MRAVPVSKKIKNVSMEVFGDVKNMK